MDPSRINSGLNRLDLDRCLESALASLKRKGFSHVKGQSPDESEMKVVMNAAYSGILITLIEDLGPRFLGLAPGKTTMKDILRATARVKSVLDKNPDTLAYLAAVMNGVYATYWNIGQPKLGELMRRELKKSLP